MRPRFLGIMLLAAGSVLSAQTLTCPPVTAVSGRPCEYHFHVLMYRPDTRAMVELYGINHFASQSSCNDARDAAVKRNQAVVAHFRPIDNNYKVDVFGDCHCDMTVEKNSPNFLTDAMRTQQIRTAEEIRLRVRERLLDTSVTSDAELVRGLTAMPPPSPFLGGPKFVPLPQPPATAAVTNPQDDLKMTKAIDSGAPRTASLDLPLVDIALPGAPPPAAATTESQPAVVAASPGPQPPASPQPAAPQPAPAPAPAEPLPTMTIAAPPQTETQPATEVPSTTAPAAIDGGTSSAVQTPAPAPQPAVAAAPEVSAEDAADAFISVESQRVNNIIAAAGAITDGDKAVAVIQACTERNAVLSNLRSLIVGAGSRSRLAAAAAKAHDESERLAFVAKLFGDDIPRHWAPKDATDAILNVGADFDAEKIVRNANAPLESRKLALYVLLARTQPAEDQQMWLNTIIDGFLQ